MGGKKRFVDSLLGVFNNGHYDPTNEPDIAFPYLFSRIKGEEWRTQQLVTELLDKHYTNTIAGIPGNDDTGTMSAWAVFSMIGIYPDCPGEPYYTITTPRFDSVEIDTAHGTISIDVEKESDEDMFIDTIMLGNKAINRYRITHDELIENRNLTIKLKH